MRTIQATKLTTILMALLMLTSGCIAGKLRAGDRDAKKGRWFEALAHYEKALSKRPGDKRIESRVRQAKIEIGKIFVERAERAHSSGKLIESMDLFGEALRYDPESHDAKRKVQPVAAKLMRRGDDAMKAKDLETAAVSYRAVFRVLPDHPGARDKSNDASTQFASQLRRRAEEDLKNDWCGNALVSAARSLAYYVEPEANDLMNSAKSCLTARTGIYPVFAPTPKRSLIADAVMGNLYRAIGDLPGFYPANQRRGKRDNETLIFIEMINHQEVEDVEEDRKTKTETRDGTKTRAYQQLEEQQEELEDALVELANEKQEIENLPAGQKPPRPLSEVIDEIEEKTKELAEVKAKLDDMESSTVEFVYTVNEVTRRSIARYFVRVDDPLIGRWDQTIDVEVSASDTHIPEVRGSNTIEPDPLELPPYSELAHQLSDRSTEVLLGTLAQAREARRAEHIRAAQALEQQGNERKAIESYADAAFLLPRTGNNPAGNALGFRSEMDWRTLLR